MSSGPLIKKKGSGRADAKSAAAPIADRPVLFRAIGNFVDANTNAESSALVKALVAELGECASLREAFEAPLRHRLFGFDAALLWVLFLSVAPAKAVKEGDPPMPDSFSAREALGVLASTFDRGIQCAVLDHFESDGEDEPETEPEPEPEPEDAGAAGARGHRHKKHH